MGLKKFVLASPESRVRGIHPGQDSGFSRDDEQVIQVLELFRAK